MTDKQALLEATVQRHRTTIAAANASLAAKDSLIAHLQKQVGSGERRHRHGAGGGGGAGGGEEPKRFDARNEFSSYFASDKPLTELAAVSNTGHGQDLVCDPQRHQ